MPPPLLEGKSLLMIAHAYNSSIREISPTDATRNTVVANAFSHGLYLRVQQLQLL